MSKLLSIIIPCNNVVGKFHIVEGLRTIDSPDVEIIFIEDNSTDDTAALIEKEATTLNADWQMERGRFGGPGPARDRGVALSSGKYLWFVDADDLMMPQAIIANLTEFRERDHDYYAFGIVKFVKSKNNALTAEKAWHMPTTDAQSLFERMQPLWMCNIIFRRDFLDRYGIGFLPHVYVQVDFYMIVQVLVHAKTYRIIDTYGYEYLHHANSLSHEPIRPRSLSKWISTIRILEFVETHAPEEYATFDIAAQKIGLVYDWSRYIESGQYRELIEAFPYIVATLRQHGLERHIATFLNTGSLPNRILRRCAYWYARAKAIFNDYDLDSLKRYYLEKERANAASPIARR
ncbi:MAG: glycosyltransferase family 2 protein [Pontixanthobacter sp.]